MIYKYIYISLWLLLHYIENMFYYYLKLLFLYNIYKTRINSLIKL